MYIYTHIQTFKKERKGNKEIKKSPSPPPPNKINLLISFLLKTLCHRQGEMIGQHLREVAALAEDPNDGSQP